MNNSNLTKQDIINKYPTIFRDANKSHREYTMGRGLEIPDEWLPVIDVLCNALENGKYIRSYGPKKAPQVIANQVKSKFGQLRFYYHLEHVDKEWEKNARIEEIVRVNQICMAYCDGIILMAEIMVKNLGK